MDIVEVTAHFFKKGDIICYDEYSNDDFYLFEKSLDETIADYKPPKDESTNNLKELIDGDVIFTEDNIAFCFNWVGESRCPMNATDYMVDECGIEDTFGEDLEYFVEIAKRKIVPEPKKLRTMTELMDVIEKSDEKITHLKFLLKYEYKSWRDDYTGEWDCSYECKGELEI